MFISDLGLIFQLFLASSFLGLIGLPFSYKLFPKLIDKGYFLSRIATLLVVSYVFFTLANFHILQLGLPSLLLLLIVWGGLNLFLFLRSKEFSLPWKVILLEEAIFLGLLTILVFVKGHQPEIYQIERFMDFGFIQSLTQSQYLPLEDIWRAGHALNYYYFGHFLAFVLITLNQWTTLTGFFLIQCWLLATMGVLVFVASSSLVRNWQGKYLSALIAGIISLVVTIFGGEWHSFTWALEKTKAELLNLPIPSYWYADSFRNIPHIISEVPIYSFIVADLHAHVWGMLLATIVLTVLINWWFEKENNFLLWASTTFLLGIAILANTWDIVTLGSVVFVFLALRFRKVGPIVACFSVAILIAFPWFRHYDMPLGGIGLVKTMSPLKQWLQFWGAGLSLVLVYLLFQKKSFRDLTAYKSQGLVWLVVICALFWIAFIEVFYTRDILKHVDWYRANTFFKVSLQVIVWLGILSGPMIYSFMIKAKGQVRYFILSFLTIWICSRLVYPLVAIPQANLEGKEYTGITSGLNFWQQKYPADFAAYKFLKEQDRGVVLEASGDSYKDTSFYSTFLGWPTISGWPIHEWTWQGRFDEIENRIKDISAIYTGDDKEVSKQLLREYKVRYIIIGSTENRKYSKSLKLELLKTYGSVIFDNSEVIIIRTPYDYSDDMMSP